MSAEKKKKKHSRSMTIAACIVVAVLLSAVICLITKVEPGEKTQPTENFAAESDNSAAQNADGVISLNDYLVIDKVDKYTGIYMEDGTDEPVTGVLMMEVTNTSETSIQYAEIILNAEGKELRFTVTALPAGASAVLLERNRAEYSENVNYMDAAAECINLSLFEKELSIHEDKLKIQVMDGVLNITNISEEDIEDTIILCYKGYQNDMYYGGIAYRIKLEAGLKAGEICQISADHFQHPGSRVVFADFAAE